jgi:hypothetical protein
MKTEARVGNQGDTDGVDDNSAQAPLVPRGNAGPEASKQNNNDNTTPDARSMLPDCFCLGALDVCKQDADGMIRAEFASPLRALAFLVVIMQATERERGWRGADSWNYTSVLLRRENLRPGWRIGFDSGGDAPLESKTVTVIRFPSADCDFVHRLANRCEYDEYLRENWEPSEEPVQLRSLEDAFVIQQHLSLKRDYFRAQGWMKEGPPAMTVQQTEAYRAWVRRTCGLAKGMYPKHELVPPSDYERGVLQGKLAALEWLVWPGSRGIET